MPKQPPQLIVALDVDTFDEARHLVDILGPAVDIFKIGSQLFTACGPVIVRHVMACGKNVFLDLKYHDIPNTVANAVSSAVGLSFNVFDVLDKGGEKSKIVGELAMCTVHTVGGEEMLKRAVQSAASKARELGVKKPLIIGISILTSEASRDNIQQVILERARLAKMCALDGVVASSQEASLIRSEFGDDFIIVAPGIRPLDAESNDQKRVTTPSEAVKNGSNFLVVGRPVVKAADPVSAAQKILEEMRRA